MISKLPNIFSTNFRSSPDVGNYTSSSRFEKRVNESRNYNSFGEAGVDTSPIIKVFSMGEHSSARRDSWDAINKTRNILSDRSLESLANLTESQLDSDLRRIKAEEHSKLILNEQSYRYEHSGMNNILDNNRKYYTFLILPQNRY